VNWSILYGIPIGVLLGILLAAYWPFGKGPEGPPYVSFDEKLDAYIGDRESFKNSPYVSLDPGERVTGRAYYKLGDPPGTSSILPGTEIHRQAEAYHATLLNDVNKTWNQHPGQPCSPQCWRKPDGHRWGDVH
jgi:hypothetical protein